MRSPYARSLLTCILTALGGLMWGEQARGATYTGFSNPQPVVVEGYAGSAMEPFVTQDGQYLLFNTSNVPPAIPSLQLATRTGAQAFRYVGQLDGEAVNEAGVLSGTPTMDRAGDFYFISPRSYSQTLSTVYAGEFASGEVSEVHLLQGVSVTRPGLVDFDVSVSPDGATMYVSVGDFSGGSGPTTASVVMFDKTTEGFSPDQRSASLLHAVNKAGTLDYAPCVSGDGLELFFTRAQPTKARGTPAIFRAVRTSVTRPFGRVQRVGAITGFAEGPSLSADGKTLYYHQLVGQQFEIASVTRP